MKAIVCTKYGSPDGLQHGKCRHRGGVITEHDKALHLTAKNISRTLIAFCLALVSFIPFAYQQHDISAPTEPLQPGTMLLWDHTRIWILNPQTLTLELYFEPELPPNYGMWDVQVSPGGRYIYFITGLLVPIDALPEDATFQLVRLDTVTRESEVVFEHPNLSRNTVISPEGNRTILPLINTSDLPDSSVCLLNADTGDCPTIDANINPNELFWLDNDTFVTFLYDAVEIYTFQANTLLEHQSITQNNWHLSSSWMLPDRQHIIISVSVLENDEYKYGFASLDLNTLELSYLPFTVARDIDAALDSLESSPNGQYLKYTRSTHLDVVDFQTGEPIVFLDDVQRSIWSPDSQSIIAFVRPSNPRQGLKLARLDIPSGQLTETAEFYPGEEYFLVVP